VSTRNLDDETYLWNQNGLLFCANTEGLSGRGGAGIFWCKSDHFGRIDLVVKGISSEYDNDRVVIGFFILDSVVRKLVVQWGHWGAVPWRNEIGLDYLATTIFTTV
jgi:hypothetical protein